MKKLRTCLIILIVFCFLFLGSCAENSKIDQNKPVTLRFWHNYAGYMIDTLNDMVNEFNSTVGQDNNIFVVIETVSESEVIADKLIASSNNEPGSYELPDITTVYPQVAVSLYNKNLLVDFNDYFTKDELSKYVDSFLTEGQFENEGQYLLPAAKSTEVLLVNKTLFDEFSEECQAGLSDLTTFEGIAKVAKTYYDWTDKKTPGVENDGKTFIGFDDINHVILIGSQQLGYNLISNNNISSVIPEPIIENILIPASKGHISNFDGYNSSLALTEEVVCYTSSSAGVLFFPETVTYNDNTKKDIELLVLPYPSFENGEKIALSRGAMLAAIKSSKEKEAAASLFIKWFTNSERNTEFLKDTGYLCVQKKAYTDLLECPQSNEENIIKMQIAVSSMIDNYTFYSIKPFDGIDDMLTGYNYNIRSEIGKGLVFYIENGYIKKDFFR